MLPKDISGAGPDLTRPIWRSIERDADFQFLLIPEELHALIRNQLGNHRKYCSGGVEFHDDAGKPVRAKSGIIFQGSNQACWCVAHNAPRSKHRVTSDSTN